MNRAEPLNQEEREHVNNTWHRTLQNLNDPIWYKAFRYYNEKQKRQEVDNILSRRTVLYMSCGSCYKKVLDFINSGK